MAKSRISRLSSCPAALAGPKVLSATTVALLLAALLAACAPREPRAPVEIETEEIDAPIDAEASTEDDLKAVRQAATLSGVLPGDFPADVPVVVPASVVDFGPAAGDRAYLELDTGRTPDEVRSWLGRVLPAAGWTVRAIGAEGLEATKGPRRLDYRLTGLSPGTRIRIEYRP